MKSKVTVTMLAMLAAVSLTGPVRAAQYTAFSLKVAQERIEKAEVGDPDTISDFLGLVD